MMDNIGIKDLLKIAIQRNVKTDAEIALLIELFLARGKLYEADKAELLGLLETQPDIGMVSPPPSLEERVAIMETILMELLI